MEELKTLARLHMQTCRTLTSCPLEKLMLWYGDLLVEVDAEEVSYRCPVCGMSLRVFVEEFIHRDSSEDLRCTECRGDVEERGGAMG